MGKMEIDWPALTMTFTRGDKRIVLKGDPTLTRMEVSLKRMTHAWEVTDQGYLVELQALTTQEETQATELRESKRRNPPEMEDLLEEYKDVFQSSNALLPPRAIDHRIQLEKGEAPVNVRPYRYAQVQKTEIENMIAEMIQKGIIRPSVSPYPSPVILVKKDGNLRFCVDYTASNQVTIPNKFPIPMIDELLDELHGSTIYSKIELKSGYHQTRMALKMCQKRRFALMRDTTNS